MVDYKKYSFSFTAASALIPETLVISEEYDRLRDWTLVRESVMNKNLLNKVKEATIKREFTEVKKRVMLLTDGQLSLLVNGSSDDVRAMILLGLVKTYHFLKDFIVEVVRNKYLVFDKPLHDIDYIKFFNSKVLFHSELENLTDSTKKKIKQVIFRILEEVYLFSNTKIPVILKPALSNYAVQAIVEDDPFLLNCFLFSNDEIRVLASNYKNV
ncbi:DUF1819 family protein [Dyadobacter sp. 3J3]|uniref:DUF1819 family protein n=1 Tax=Dyadobacter sp. 3J3 TaxID=2606600 RepID=UPI00135C09F8|nr:DUF1819 family protein [Dyadobacter sp. 3J3]